MINTLYIEEEVRDHPRTLALLERFPKARHISCYRYTEIFNRKAQNFRLQKQSPALILAKKHGKKVLQAPQEYSLGSRHNYYFSHMLNCLYDCRYCFLQGMYRSANYVLFVNYEDFITEICETARQHTHAEPWFFSGYDCDSLALEPITQFASHFLPLFETLSGAYMELRTKSTQIRTLLDRDALPNCVVAMSLAPQAVINALEHKTPSLASRLDALQRLQAHGWPIGLRFDPLIYTDDYRPSYTALFTETFNQLDPQRIHSVSIGNFRLPQGFFQTLLKLYPEERLFAGPFNEQKGMISYPIGVKQAMLDFATQALSTYIPENKVLPCT